MLLLRKREFLRSIQEILKMAFIRVEVFSMYTMKPPNWRLCLLNDWRAHITEILQFIGVTIGNPAGGVPQCVSTTRY